MDPESNPYTPGAGASPPALVGREREIEDFSVALTRLGKGVHARSVILDGFRGVGKTVLLREFNHAAREKGWVTSGVVECDEDEDLRRIIAKLCHRALREISKRRKASDSLKRALGVLKAFTFTFEDDAKWHFKIDVDAVTGTADSGDPEVDIVELMVELGSAASDNGNGVVLILDEMQFLDKEDLSLLAKALHQISQELHPIVLAGAGLPQLPLMMKENKLYVERLFSFRTIDSLPRAQAAKALTVPAGRADVTYERDALEHILKQSQGYPYFLQQWGEMVWNEAPVSPIELEDVLAAQDLVTEELDRRFFRDRYNTATDAERMYMAAMADLGPRAHSSGAIATHLGKSAKQVSVRRDALIKKGLIYSPVDQELDFTVPHFAEFMKRVQPFDPAQRLTERRGRPARA
jgi:hypothetical protein